MHAIENILNELFEKKGHSQAITKCLLIPPNTMVGVLLTRKPFFSSMSKFIPALTSECAFCKTRLNA